MRPRSLQVKIVMPADAVVKDRSGRAPASPRPVKVALHAPRTSLIYVKAALTKVRALIAAENSGGANISAVGPMPLPAEFVHHFAGATTQRFVWVRFISLPLVLGMLATYLFW